MGVRGVRLKKYEEAVADLLESGVEPSFVRLPPIPCSIQQEHCSWPFDRIHPLAHVRGELPGQLAGNRAFRKEAQLRSMLRCVSSMIDVAHSSWHRERPFTIVDFCGGTGHLALPLALLYPECQIVVVDLKAISLKLLHKKASQCAVEPDEKGNAGCSVSFLDNNFYQKGSDTTVHEQIKRQCAHIPNLYTFHGSIETFREDFDIGIALHACGEASDVVLRSCGAANANFCVSPCCVGKLHRRRRDPYVYHATSANVATIEYPQSREVRSVVDEPHWDDLCKAADYGNLQEVRTPRNATRRTAKALLETDRLLYMKQTFGYETALTRMDPWECSAKNDILLGWRPENERRIPPFQSILLENDQECSMDIERARRHLLSCEIDEDPVEWSNDEEECIRSVLADFVASDSKQEYMFPTGMGPRKRKLVHLVAEQLGLAHWCPGKTHASKTVAVRKR